MNELKINVVEFTPTPIKWNEQEVKEVVDQITAKYDGLEFGEDDIASAKKDRAALNKVAKSLSAKRIDIKKQYTSELTQFEDTVKSYEKQIKTTSSAIDEQIKAYEEKQKEEKRQAIIELAEYKQVQDYIMFDEKWLNKSYKFDDIIAELVQAKESIDKDINIVKMACTDKSLEADKYIERLKQMELAQVLERINEDYALLHEKAPEPEAVEEIDPDEIKQEELLEIVRVLKGTKTQLVKLKEYADKIGVTIEKVA